MSTEFNLDVAKSTLQSMGIHTRLEGNTHEESTIRDASSTDFCQLPPSTVQPRSYVDPLLSITRDEAIRLCRVLEEESVVLYPLLDIKEVISHANFIYTVLEAAKS
jgi:hypothetical protein